MYLTETELKSTYYTAATSMDAGDITRFLARANSYAHGKIGGVPPVIDEHLKAAVALAFEHFSKGDTAQVNDVNGDITAAAPEGQFVKDKKDPLKTVDVMVAPYAAAFDSANAAQAERSIKFL